MVYTSGETYEAFSATLPEVRYLRHAPSGAKSVLANVESFAQIKPIHASHWRSIAVVSALEAGVRPKQPEPTFFSIICAASLALKKFLLME